MYVYQFFYLCTDYDYKDVFQVVDLKHDHSYSKIGVYDILERFPHSVVKDFADNLLIIDSCENVKGQLTVSNLIRMNWRWTSDSIITLCDQFDTVMKMPIYELGVKYGNKIVGSFSKDFVQIGRRVAL